MNNKEIFTLPGQTEVSEEFAASQAAERAASHNEHAPTMEMLYLIGADIQSHREDKISSEEVR